MVKSRNRLFLPATATAIALAAAAGGLYASSGSERVGGRHSAYPAGIERALAKTIDPALQRAGALALNFAVEHPDVCDVSNPIPGILSIACEGLNDTKHNSLDVLMKSTGPKGLGLTTVYINDKFPNSTTSETTNEGFTLASPTGIENEGLLSGQNHTFRGTDVSGWAAQEFGVTKGSGDKGNSSFTYDTTDNNYFVTADYYPAGSEVGYAVSTAQAIAQDITGDLLTSTEHLAQK